MSFAPQPPSVSTAMIPNMARAAQILGTRGGSPGLLLAVSRGSGDRSAKKLSSGLDSPHSKLLGKRPSRCGLLSTDDAILFTGLGYFDLWGTGRESKVGLSALFSVVVSHTWVIVRCGLIRMTEKCLGLALDVS